MVKTITIKVSELTCDKCGTVWQIPADKPLPKVCVGCKSRLWNGKEVKR